MPISVVVADDHQLVISALRAAFAGEDLIRIVGETRHGSEVATLVAAVRPRVLLLDLNMPDVDGFEVLRRLGERGSTARVVILSMHTTAAYASRALKLGALGYVGKTAPASELGRAITAAANDQRYLAPPLTEDAVREYDAHVDEQKLDPYETLSRRERDVMRLAALGGTSRSIAKELGIGHRTVETHVANVMRKLGIASRAELVRYAVRVRLID